MKIGIKRAKEDPSRLVLQVEELEEDMTPAMLALTRQVRAIVNPEPAGINAVAFGFPEEMTEEDKRELKIALVNLVRSVLTNPQMVQTVLQQAQETQLVALPREQLQGIMEELTNLRIQLARTEVKSEAFSNAYEEGKKIIIDFMRLFKMQRNIIIVLVSILGVLGALGMLNFLWRILW